MRGSTNRDLAQEASVDPSAKSGGNAPFLSASGLVKRYGSGEASVIALDGVNLDLCAGELTAVVGPSGSGKSTLMHLLSGLDVPTEGRVTLDGHSLADMTDRELAKYRARFMGFVLQQNNLIPSLTIAENVAAPLIISGQRRSEAVRRARQLLEAVGLSHRADAWPSQVSGGEAQRAVVARACGGSPRFIFADEPTGALDTASGAVVLELFRRMVSDSGAAALLITHDPSVAAMADRTVRLRDGSVEEDS
jgi:ABC-type lipoprotein export system ATPase subunit